MPTTNISQIVLEILHSCDFKRKDQLNRLFQYTIGLSLPKHVNQTRISKHVWISQSSISRTLSSGSISTHALTDSRISKIRQFVDSINLNPVYLIIDETVIKRYGKKKIENLSRFYSSIEKHVVKGTELLTSLLWINSKTYFPLHTSMADASQPPVRKFIRMLDENPFKELILLVDGGIMSSEFFFETVKRGYTIIGRFPKTVDVVLEGMKIPLKKISANTASVSSMVVRIPAYASEIKLVFDNRLKDDSRVIISSDTSMGQEEILNHYSKRTYIETYFKMVKNELGLKCLAYSAESTLRHVEAVQMFFTAWMISRFWLNAKEQVGFREFVESMRLCFYFSLFMACFSSRDPGNFLSFDFVKS